MSVRIIAGSFKGRRLQTPPGHDTRPLLDRIKQSLFDRLGPALVDARVVDCCAGSGSFGCEALSRGAAEVFFIEQAATALRCLRHNLHSLGDPPAARLLASDVARALPGLQQIDLCFADPPFPWFREQDPALDQLLLHARDCLHPHGRLLIRGERGYDLPVLPTGLVEVERWQWGRSWIQALRPVTER